MGWTQSITCDFIAPWMFTRALGTWIRPDTWREGAVTLNARLACYSFCRDLVSCSFWWTFFLSHLSLAIWFLQTPDHTATAFGKAGWVCFQLLPNPLCFLLRYLIILIGQPCCGTRTWRRHSSHSPVIVTNWNGKQDNAPEEKLIMGCLVGRKWIT